jgi:hypothetical protein
MGVRVNQFGRRVASVRITAKNDASLNVTWWQAMREVAD